MHFFFEKGVRVGVSYISDRYGKANNKYLKSKHIIYLNGNNLHGCALPNIFPTSGFKWIDSKDFDSNK